MNWSKIKTILIGILVITNIILLVQLFTRTKFEKNNTLDDVLKLYQAKGVEIEVKFGHGPSPEGGAQAGASVYSNLAYMNTENQPNGNRGAMFVTAPTTQAVAVSSEEEENTKSTYQMVIPSASLIPANMPMYVDLDAIPEKLYGYSAVRHVFSDAHVSGIEGELNKLQGEFTIDMDSQSLSIYYTGRFHPDFDADFEYGEMYQASEDERAAFAAEAMEMLRVIGLGGLEILDLQTSKFYDVDWSRKPVTTPSVTPPPHPTTDRKHSYTVCRLYKSLQPDGGIDTESGIFVVFSSEGQLLGIFVQDLMAIAGASERPYDIIPVQEALFKALDRVERGDVLKRFRIVFKLNDESIPADDIVRGEMLPYYELYFVEAGKVHIRATN